MPIPFYAGARISPARLHGSGRDQDMRKRKYSSLTSGYDQTSELAPLPTVHNIVATSQILSTLKTLDLNHIHETLPFSFYDQSKFAAITVRLHQPDCTTLLFSSGKLVVTGCRTWYQCVYASLFITGLLRECVPGHTFQLATCDVQNMVAHVEIPLTDGYLDLHAMYNRLALNCTYQRKMFPGLIFRPESSPVVLLCFFSGKIVITGGKTMQDIFSGWNRLWPILQNFIVAQPCQHPLGSRPTHKRHTPRRSTSHEPHRQQHERLPLERNARAGDPSGSSHGLEQSTGSHLRRAKTLDLHDPAELQGLGDNLAAERTPPLL